MAKRFRSSHRGNARQGAKALSRGIRSTHDMRRRVQSDPSLNATDDDIKEWRERRKASEGGRHDRSSR